jgi:ribosome-binding factor A
MTRVNELLKREIAGELYRVMNDRGFDLSAITVTRVDTSPNLRHARVYVSVRDHQGEREHMLRQVESHRAEIQQHLNKHTKLKYTPHLDFKLDESIEAGDKVLSIISQLEIPDEDPEDDGEA